MSRYATYIFEKRDDEPTYRPRIPSLLNTNTHFVVRCAALLSSLFFCSQFFFRNLKCRIRDRPTVGTRTSRP